ncbi:microtubule-actin cross-linking factor isoforms 1 2 3 5 [Micractinium conductrix]|uniref:non-specific serine/threonine protein kinase n=1 Tax=Micractinium conductrix TaxID=554055 RepID=A0A2P6V5J7_9CHLO|nr:microtubule-actin cross-linking factor isoforms 1 2 3 5 [Micractinium conductrix]|eukprot:PSC69337.1 microtubule-actin cross-linking factor isoforms 1 2 3 5 [Micractinium conductrix]
MGVSLGSMESTLHGMLEACVTEALGPSPPAKRKLPDEPLASVGQEQRCLNADAAAEKPATQQEGGPPSGGAPPSAKKLKLDLGSPAATQAAAAPAAASAATAADAAPTEPAAVQPAATAPPAPMELCSAVVLPSQAAAPTCAALSPAAEPPVTAPNGAARSPALALPAAAAGLAPTQPCCAPAVDLDAAVGELLGGGEEEQPLHSTQLAPPVPSSSAGAAALGQHPAGEPSDESTWAQAEVGLEATQPVCSGDDSSSVEVETAEVDTPAPTCGDGAAEEPAAEEAAAPGSATEPARTAHHSPPVPAAAPPTEPLPLPALHAAAAAPPTDAAAPPACVASLLAIAAAHPPPPGGGLLVRCPAPSIHSTLDDSQQPGQPSTHVNMLKVGIDHDFYEPGSASSGQPASQPASQPYSASSPTDSQPSGVHGGWTTSGSCAEEGPSPSPSPPPHAAAAPRSTSEFGPIADYEVLANEVGSGGLGRVYAAVHHPSGRPVALKLGGAFDPRNGADDFTWATFKTEWNAYAHLASAAAAASGAACSASAAVPSGAGGPLPWMAEPFECGLWEDGCGGVAPWMTLSLLGPSLHTLNQQRRAAVVDHLPAYARGMLAAVEGLHRHGLIHNDIKPANFVVPLGFDPSPPVDAAPAAPGDLAPPLQRLPKGETPPQSHPPPRILLIDFGFAFDADPAKAGQPWPFVGTPDFAASVALEGRRPGQADDLEALAYTLVELAAGQVPWDITRHPGTEAEISDWSATTLHGMLARRRAALGAARADGRVPAWLGGWVDYCVGLPAGALPDYDHLRSLIPDGDTDAGAAAKAGAAARAAAWMDAEE